MGLGFSQVAFFFGAIDWIALNPIQVRERFACILRKFCIGQSDFEHGRLSE